MRDSFDPSGIEIRDFEQRHLSSLVAAHEACFPGFFLTNLGPGFLTHYYRNYLQSGHGMGVVAVTPDGQVIGFATGTSDLDGQDAALLRRHFFGVAWAVLRSAITNGEVRTQILQKLSRFADVLTRFVRRSAGASREPAPGRPEETATHGAARTPESAPSDAVKHVENGPGATAATTSPQEGASTGGAAGPAPRIPAVTLTSLGVLPGHRGSGLSAEIVAAFEDVAQRHGFRRVRVSTALDNHRARAFYEKIGWTVEGVREHQNGIDFEHLPSDH